jgi:Fur family transcriptional regulator, ferric uptake regulator
MMGSGGSPGQHEPVTALRARGERLTPQRLMVLEAIQATQGHQTAETIHQHVREHYPYVNLATVYRTLHWLKDHGLVSETDLGTGQSEYEYLGDGRHHHMVCLHCGDKAEFGDELLASLSAALHAQYGFAPRIDHLAVFGLCRHCQGAAAEQVLTPQ